MMFFCNDVIDVKRKFRPHLREMAILTSTTATADYLGHKCAIGASHAAMPLPESPATAEPSISSIRAQSPDVPVILQRVSFLRQ